MDFALTNPEANHASRKEAMDRQLVLREEVEAKKEAAAVAAMQLLVRVDPEGVVRLSDRDLENTAARAAVELLLPPPDDFGRVLYVKVGSGRTIGGCVTHQSGHAPTSTHGSVHAGRW